MGVKVTRLEEIIFVLKNHNGIASYKMIYEGIENLLKTKLTNGQKAGVRKTIEIYSSDSKLYAGEKDIFFSVDGIGNGTWGLREFFNLKTEVAFDSNINFEDLGNDNYSRVKTEIYRIIRDTELSKKIKSLYDNKCQICGNQLQLNGKSYSEAHHIKPLGKFNGPDKFDNLIVVCPNCHVKLDYGAIKIEMDKIKEKKHLIAQEYIDFHNQELFGKK